jgi:hypothetical protein
MCICTLNKLVIYMAWGWGGRGHGGWFGPWSGRGPFSHLPPWERPGWMLGKGACWRARYEGYPSIFRPNWYQTSPYAPLRREDEMTALEESKKDLEEELKGVEARIEELKKSLEAKKQEPRRA